MLYRAITHLAYPYGTLDSTEVVVFFESWLRGRAYFTFQSLVTQAWNAPIDRIAPAYLDSESELLLNAFGDATTGDARLLEIGMSRGRPVYSERARTLLMVSPRMLRRLVAAQVVAEQLVSGAGAPVLPGVTA